MIDQDTGLINDNTGMIIEADYTKYTASGRRKRSRERGPDKKPRAYHVNSMRNLAQFNEKPQEFVQCLKEEKGIDISDYSKLTRNVWIVTGFIVVMVVGMYLYDWHKNKKNDDSEDANKISNQER